MKPGLRELLVCPTCKDSLLDKDGKLRCVACGREYPVEDGVPVFLPDVLKETKKPPGRTGYGPWYYFYTIGSLPKTSHILDIGAGDMDLNHPNIFRLDVFRGANVDVVADVCSMPFREGAFDFVFSIAVLEHLADPFSAADEMLRVTRPGGYVYADTNFVFPYHGYPHHYFNFSVDGIAQVFRKLEKIHVTVPPYLMPSQALRSVLDGYLMWFKARNKAERRCYELVRRLREFALLQYDSAFDQEQAHVIAAGVCFYGRRQGAIGEGPIPREVLGIWENRPDLHAIIPNPYDLSGPVNVMTWAESQGRSVHEELQGLFEKIELIGTESLGQIAPPDETMPAQVARLGYRSRRLARSAFDFVAKFVRFRSA